MRRELDQALTRRQGVVLGPVVLLHAGLVLAALWVLLGGQGAGLAAPLGAVLLISVAVAAVLAVGLVPSQESRWRPAITLGLALVALFAGLRFFWQQFL
ncbi:MAG: hypothetical protein AAF409_00690 [Pseudomonadota bacterium]